MPYIDKETVEKAKQVDLLTYLRCSEPDELVRFSGNTFTTKTHDSLKISNGRFYWWSQGTGGRNALDYLMIVKGLSFTEAVETVLELEVPAPSVPAINIPSPPASKALSLPKRHWNNDAVREYLAGRGIDEVICGGLLHAGRIYESHNKDRVSGKAYSNAVFIGADSAGTPRYAAIRGIDSEYKGEAAGSDKRYSFFIPAIHPNEHLHIFEGAIDLLSYASLMKQSGQELRSVHLLSLGGVYLPRDGDDIKMPQAISGYVDAHDEIKNIHFHLDNDVAGQLCTEALIAVLSDKFECKNEPPEHGNDYNDYLLHCRSPSEIMRGGGQKTKADFER
jgi:hypothetical protein